MAKITRAYFHYTLDTGSLMGKLIRLGRTERNPRLSENKNSAGHLQ